MDWDAVGYAQVMSEDREDAPLANPPSPDAIPDDQPVSGLPDADSPEGMPMGVDPDEDEAPSGRQAMPGIPEPGVEPASDG